MVDATTLLSGLAGAILAVVLTKCIEGIVFYLRRRSLYKAIYAECLYNLNIVDEMCDGMLAGATFKRMSVEFFKEMREEAVQYAIGKNVLRKLSCLIVDLELYNREADCIFDQFVGKYKPTKGQQLNQTILAAREGVSGSLKVVMELVCSELGEGDGDED